MKEKKSSGKVKILTLNLPVISKLEAKKRMLEMMRAKKCSKVYTPNPQMALGCARSRDLTEIFSRAELLIPDGIGLIMASKILGSPLPERITGIDSAEFILKYAAKHDLSVAFLGARPLVAERAAELITKKLPSLRVVYTHHGYFEKDGEENRKIVKQLSDAAPDILFVCFGFPAQELWIDKNAKNIPSLRLCMGLGGVLDVLSGNTRRAPKTVQRLRLEWLWRTLGDKKRYRNFIDIVDFMLLVFTQKSKKKY